MAFTKATFDYLDSGGLINWQLTAQTANFPAVSGEGYLVDTSSAAITVTLPTAPSAGDEIIIVDYASNAGTNNITLDPGTLNLRGATTDLVLDNDNQTARLLYSGATKGWLVTTEAGAGAAATPDLTVDYLIAAGGGGGGYQYAGGGGAGGLIIGQVSKSVNTNYTVEIGNGGAGGITKPQRGSVGGDSIFDDITADGGGGGGGWDGAISGGNGGSGGGAAMGITTNTVGSPAGTSTQTSPASGTGYGNSGGTGYRSSTNNYRGGGGGGAGAAGDSASQDTSDVGADGGIGFISTIISSANAATASVGEVSASNVYFSGGGGAGNNNGTSRTLGGIGGGGRGATNESGGSGEYATAGSPNTGGGGGGGIDTRPGGNEVGMAGGSGVVILRYPDAYTITVGSGITEASGSPFTEGSDKVSVFTGGTGNIQFLLI